jgi:DNA modification methylase
MKETLFKITDDIVISEINNESVILNLISGVYFQVNELGTFIISQLEDYSTFETLNDKIIKDFNVTKKESEKDLLIFIKDLESKNLLHFKK